MRISDWSSDVCSSDLLERPQGASPRAAGCDAGSLKGGVEGSGTGLRAPWRLGTRIAWRGLENDCGRQKAADHLPVPLIVTRRAETRRGTASLVAIAERSEEHTSELQSLMRISY